MKLRIFKGRPLTSLNWNDDDSAASILEQVNTKMIQNSAIIRIKIIDSYDIFMALFNRIL